MVDDTQTRVMALIEPWNGRSLLTFRKKHSRQRRRSIWT